MIPLLLAASLAVSAPGLQRDLTAPSQRLLDAPTPAPISKDLKGPGVNLFNGKSPYILKIAPGAPLPPGAVLSSEAMKELYANQLCNKRVVETLAPAPNPNPLAPKIITPDGLKKLGDLPPGLLEHAINRTINGCPVREIVFGGQTYYLDMPVAKLERTDPMAFRSVQH